MTTPERPPFRLADEEVDDLDLAFHNARIFGTGLLLEYVTELCESYRASGLVEGDLAHDGTVRWEARA